MADEDSTGKVRLKYVGPSHYREISAADFKSVGVDDQGQVRVANESALVVANDWKTPQVAEVSPDAADFLLASEPDDWQETDEEVAPPAKARATAQRLARAAAREGRELAKSSSQADTATTDGAGSGDAGTAVTTGGASTGGGRSRGSSR